MQVGTWSDGSFTAISGKKFGADGSVALSFAEAGSYIVSAEGEFFDDYGNQCPVMPPYCIVTVEEAAPVVNGYLSDLRVELDITGDACLTGFDSSAYEYIVEVPASEKDLLVGAQLSEHAPEGSTITAKYIASMYGYTWEQSLAIHSAESGGTYLGGVLEENML